MKNNAGKKTIVFMAPTPPPYMGPSVATEILLRSRFVEQYEIIHIDTADRRPLNTMWKLDLTNILLACKHYMLLLRSLVFRHVDLVYIPICQTRIGYLKDAVFIVIAWLFRKKIVVHLRGGYFRQFYDSSDRITRFVVRRTLSCVDRAIVLGSSLKYIFAGLVPEERISVVPNGRDLCFVPPQRQSKNDEKVCVLFLSNLIETKGFKDVLLAAKYIVPRAGSTKFVFAGDWRKEQDRMDCEDFLKTEGLENHVEFHGTVVGPAKATLLQEADIFVFPTYYPMEGHPWVIVEAMAAGLPIISTDHGCIKESVIDGENGFLVPKRDPAAIAEVVGQLARDPELRRRMGRRSRELYEANFTQEHFVQRMIETIDLALESQRSS